MNKLWETPFAGLVALELEWARENHPTFSSWHEGFAILLEEVEELKAEVFKKPAKRCRMALLTELVQIGAMAQRFAEDLIKE